MIEDWADMTPEDMEAKAIELELQARDLRRAADQKRNVVVSIDDRVICIPSFGCVVEL